MSQSLTSTLAPSVNSGFTALGQAAHAVSAESSGAVWEEKGNSDRDTPFMSSGGVKLSQTGSKLRKKKNEPHKKAYLETRPKRYCEKLSNCFTFWTQVKRHATRYDSRHQHVDIVGSRRLGSHARLQTRLKIPTHTSNHQGWAFGFWPCI